MVYKCDLVIVGSGAAALTAATYAAREGMETVVLERSLIGGTMATIDQIDNYPGFSNGIDGISLAQEYQAQAERFGAKIEFAEAIGLDVVGQSVQILTREGDKYIGKACLIATGAHHRRLGLPLEDELTGRGIHYCATCDGALYKGRTLLVIGGANSAIQEALYLAGLASHLTIVVRSFVKASYVLKEKLQQYIANGKVEVFEGWTPDAILQDDKGNVIGGAFYKTDDNTLRKEIKADGVFVFAGSEPNTNFLVKSGIKLDEAGHVVTDNYMQTNLPGVFAAGDVRAGSIKQIVTASAEGATAVFKIGQYIKGVK